MRDLGALWRQYRTQDPASWRYVYRVLVGDTAVEGDKLKDLKTVKCLNDEDFEVGTCKAARLDIVIDAEGVDVPTSARIELQAKISGGLGETPWESFGVFYVDYRADSSGFLSLECYDRMLLADAPFIDTEEVLDDYPRPMGEVLSECAEHISTTLAAGVLDLIHEYEVPYPNSLTIREVLGFIGASHGGSFFINDSGELALAIPRNDTPLFDITTGNMKALTRSDPRQFSRLYMVADDDGGFYEAGDGDTSVEIFNLFATQEITDTVYTDVIGQYTYNPASVKSAKIDLALELGDSITIDGVACNLWSIEMNSGGYVNIDIPTVGDTIREFGFAGTTSSAIKRRVPLDKDIFGVAISRNFGIRVHHEDGETTGQTTLNSKTFEVTIDGQPVLWADWINKTLNFNGVLSADVLSAISDVISPYVYSENGAIVNAIVRRLRTDLSKPFRYLQNDTSDVHWQEIGDTSEVSGRYFRVSYAKPDEPPVQFVIPGIEGQSGDVPLWWYMGIIGGSMTTNPEYAVPDGSAVASTEPEEVVITEFSVDSVPYPGGSGTNVYQNLFDDNFNTYADYDGSITTLTMKLEEPYKIVTLGWAPRGDSYGQARTRDGIWYGSTDGDVYTEILRIVDIGTPPFNVITTYDIPDPQEYAYIRFACPYLNASELKIIGVKSAPSAVPVMVYQYEDGTAHKEELKRTPEGYWGVRTQYGQGVNEANRGAGVIEKDAQFFYFTMYAGDGDEIGGARISVEKGIELYNKAAGVWEYPGGGSGGGREMFFDHIPTAEESDAIPDKTKIYVFEPAAVVEGEKGAIHSILLPHYVKIGGDSPTPPEPPTPKPGDAVEIPAGCVDIANGNYTIYSECVAASANKTLTLWQHTSGSNHVLSEIDNATLKYREIAVGLPLGVPLYDGEGAYFCYYANNRTICINPFTMEVLLDWGGNYGVSDNRMACDNVVYYHWSGNLSARRLTRTEIQSWYGPDPYSFNVASIWLEPFPQKNTDGLYYIGSDTGKTGIPGYGTSPQPFTMIYGSFTERGMTESLSGRRGLKRITAGGLCAMLPDSPSFSGLIVDVGSAEIALETGNDGVIALGATTPDGIYLVGVGDDVRFMKNDRSIIALEQPPEICRDPNYHFRATIYDGRLYLL